MVTAISTLPKAAPAVSGSSSDPTAPGPALCVKPGSTVRLTALVAKALQRWKGESHPGTGALTLHTPGLIAQCGDHNGSTCSTRKIKQKTPTTCDGGGEVARGAD